MKIKAALLTEINKPLEYKSIELNEEVLTSGFSLIDMKFSSLNRRDLYISLGKYAKIKTPVILGSDGSGIVDDELVLINPSMNWVNNKAHQPDNYQILGMPQNGTFAEKLVIQKEQIYPIPAHLSLEEAATLPLAGLTAYRVLLSKCKLSKEDTVLITGAGGGVSTFAIQFSLAVGAKVFITSGNSEKIKYFLSRGVVGGKNYRVEGWEKELLVESGGFDVIIDSAGGEDFSKLLKVAKPGARIGVYGGTKGSVTDFSPQVLFWKQLNIFGSTMGNKSDFEDMLDFVSKYKIVPIIDKIFHLKNINEALERMKNQRQIGKILLKNV